MLSFIRSNVQSVFVKLIVIVIAVVMLSFGVDSFRNQGVNILATVDGLEVPLSQYQRALEGAEGEIRQRYGAQAGKLLESLDLKNQVAQRLINDALLIQAARANGILVTDLELAEAIRTAPPFLTDGRFDQDLYDQVLAQNRITTRIYEEDLRRNLTAKKFMALISSGHSVSRSYAQKLHQLNQTRYEIEALTMEQTEFLKEVTPTDKEINEYYEANQEQFRQPKRYSLAYGVIDGNSQKEMIQVREKEIKKHYQRNKEDFNLKAAWKSRHILLKVPQDGNKKKLALIKRKAEKLSKSLKKNSARFARLAKKNSQDPGSKDKGGDLGWNEAGQMIATFEATLASLKKGEVSEAILTPYGYHIIQLQDVRQGRQLSLEEATEQIKTAVIGRKLERRLNNKAAKLLEQAKQQSFAELLKAANIELKHTDPFDQSSLLPDIGIAHSLYQTLAVHPLGGKGQHLAGGNLILFEVTQIQESQIKPLAEVKEQARQMAGMNLAAKRAQKKMAQLAQKTRDPKSFALLAKQLKQSPKKISFLYQDRQVPELQAGRGLLVQTSRMKPGQVLAWPERGHAYVVHLLKRIPGDLSNPIAAAKLENQLRSDKARLLMTGLVLDYKKTVEILYNKDLAKALDLNL